jgi:hypothetical protein
MRRIPLAPSPGGRRVATLAGRLPMTRQADGCDDMSHGGVVTARWAWTTTRRGFRHSFGTPESLFEADAASRRWVPMGWDICDPPAETVFSPNGASFQRAITKGSAAGTQRPTPW